MFRRRIHVPGLWVAVLCLLLQLGRVISQEAAPASKASAAASGGGRGTYSSHRARGKDAHVYGDDDPIIQRSLADAHRRIRDFMSDSILHTTIDTNQVLKGYLMVALESKGKLALTALHELVSFHMNGNSTLGVARDPREALPFLDMAAGHYGSPQAQHLMAVAYATGIMGRLEGDDGGGPPSDEVRAIVYDYFGARGGDVHAAMAMGYRYLYGHGTPANCDASVLYYELAANAAVEELQTLKVLPPNERMRISDTGPGHQPGPKRRGAEADQQLVDYYEHTAEKGDMGAQVALGRLYYHGSQGVEQNFEKAATYFELAAKAGDPTAAGSLGLMYAQGVGVAQSNETALRYFRVGEGSGDGPSLNGLGYMHLYGMGVPQSVDKAADFFHKAAHEKGNSDAFYNLGLIYAGIVTQPEDPKDLTEKPPQPQKQQQQSQKQQQPAQQQQQAKQPDGGWGSSRVGGEPRAVVHEGAAGSKTAGSPSGTTGPPQHGASLTGQQNGGGKGERVRKNMQKALKYFSLSAQAGHMAALHKIGQMYAQGISTGKACSTAVHAFKGVAERGSWVKQLARAYNQYKRGDLDGALIDYIYLAELGYEVAQWNAGLLLEDHVCLHLSPLACQRLSFRYFTHASKQGNADASLKVGDAWYYGKAGLVVDYERAAKYYQAAAELRQPQAMFNLGFMHQHGIGLKQDFHLSKRYYDSSAETHPDSRWPVNLALLGLYVQWWYQREANDHIITTGPARPFAGMHAGSSAQQGAGWEAEVERLTVLVDEYRRWMEGEMDGGVAKDTLLILALTTLLLVVVRLRTQRERQRRRESQRAGEEGGGEATLGGQGEGGGAQTQDQDGHMHQD